jgi:hypothetical protein
MEHAPVFDGTKEDFPMKAGEAEDLSTKEFAVKDDESEIKLGGGRLSERDKSAPEAGRGGLLSTG